jgi:nucleotide-binding universal stress UspA family protein
MVRPLFSNVLVAVDGGDLTETIVQCALRLSAETLINFVCALDPANFMTPATAVVYGVEGEKKAALAAAQRVVDGCVVEAKAAGRTATGYVVEAAPVDAIIDIAARLDVDAIVIASHGRHGFARLVLGSVAEGVAHRANIPVLLVPARLPNDDDSRHLDRTFQAGSLS